MAASDHQQIPVGCSKWLVGAVLLIVLSACQMVETREEPEPEAAPAEVDEPEMRPAPLRQAIDLLQQGEADQAAALLEEILSRRPHHPLAGRLLDQIRIPPETLLGTEYREVIVEPGDSLSLLAERHLDDPLLFFALARYNDIPVPRLLEPGRSLRIPRFEADDVAPDTPTLPVADPAADARLLLASAQYREAIDRIRRLGSIRPLSSELQILLVDSVAAWLDEGEAVDSPGSQLAVIEPLTELVPDDQPGRRLGHLLTRVEAAAAFESGVMAEQRDELDTALRQYRRARSLDPANLTYAASLAELGQQLVSQWHDAALRAYRDQRPGEAAALWRQVLEIDPDFEPALVYLPRAEALQRRIDELVDE